MTRRIALLIVAAATTVGLATWAVIRFTASPAGTAPPAAATTAPANEQPVRRITATLFYVAPDGSRLAPVQREVLYGATPAEQAARVLEAQLEPPPEGMTSAVPAGVRLRGVFVADNGDAYADFSAELRLAHPGGSLNEIFTVYTFVCALTANLPAIKAVQILVDGHEAETLAGHVDLRQPLPTSDRWLALPNPAPPATPSPGATGAASR
jgi:spore germination protein GerM